MKYIRTKETICFAIDDKEVDYFKYQLGVENIKVADTIEELCDDFLFVDREGKPHFKSHDGNIWYLGFIGNNKGGFGVIYVFDESDVLHIKTVAKMNGKGEFELL